MEKYRSRVTEIFIIIFTCDNFDDTCIPALIIISKEYSVIMLQDTSTYNDIYVSF